MGRYFTPLQKIRSKYGLLSEDTPSITSRINGLENTLDRQGVNVPPMVKRGTIDRIFDALSIGQYAVMGGLKNLTDDDPNTKVFRGVLDGLKAGNPFGEGYEKGEAQFSQVLDNMNWNSETKFGRAAKGLVGFAGDVFLDPSTYFTGGIGAILKGTGKKVGVNVAKETSERVMKEAFERGLRDITDKTGKEILTRLGQDASDESIKMLTDKIRRVAKQTAPKSDDLKYFGKTIVKDDILRKIGDSTISPYFNTAVDAIKDSKIGKRTSEITNKYFRSKIGAQLKDTAFKNPEEAFKLFAASNSMFDSTKGLEDLQKNAIENAKMIFGDMDEKTIKRLTDIMENPAYWKKIEKQGIVSTKSEMNKTAQEMYDKLKGEKAVLDDVLSQYDELGNLKKQNEKLTEIVVNLGKYDNETSKIYSNLVTHATAASPLKEMSKADLHKFLNEFVHKDVNYINTELIKMGYKSDSMAMAYEIRQVLDKAREGVTPEDMKYFRGQTLDRAPIVAGTVGGQAYTPGTMSQYDAMLNKSIKAVQDGYTDEQIEKSLRKYINNEEDIQNILKEAHSRQITDADTAGWGGKSLTPEEIEAQRIKGEKQLADTQRKGAILKSIVDITSKRKTYEDAFRQKLVKFDAMTEKTIPLANQEKIVSMIMNGEKTDRIWQEMYKEKMPDAKMQNIINEVEKLRKSKAIMTNDEMYKFVVDRGVTQEDAFSLIRQANDLSKRKPTEPMLESARNKANEMMKSDKPIVKAGREELLDEKRSKYFDVMETERYNEGRAKAGYQVEEKIKLDPKTGKPYRNKFFDDLIKRQREAAEKGRDAEVFSKFIKQQLESRHYTTEEFLQYKDNWREFLASGKADNISATRSVQEIDDLIRKMEADDALWDSGEASDFTPEGGKQLNRQGKRFEEDAITTPHDTYNVHGVDIKSKVGTNPEVKPSVVRKGIEYISSKNPKLGAMLTDIEVHLSDFTTGRPGHMNWVRKEVGGKVEWTKQMILPNTTKYFGKYDKATQVIPHEVAHTLQKYVLNIPDEVWLETIQKDKNGLYKDFKEYLTKEDFAESFAKFLENPAEFKTQYPERFNVLSEAMTKAKSTKAQKNRLFDAINLEKSISIPKSARQTADEAIQSNTKRINDLVERVSQYGDRSDVMKKVEQLEADLELDRFQTIFKEMHPDTPMFEEVASVSKKFINVINEEKFPSLDKRVVEALNFLEQEFKNMADVEGIEDVIERYVPHIINKNELTPKELDELRRKGVLKFTDSIENPFNQARKYNTTISEFNKMVKAKYGVDNAFETNMMNIYLTRKMKHNQLIFNKKVVDDVVSMFGTKFSDIKDAPTGRIFVSLEDAMSTLSNIQPDNINTLLRGLNVTDDIQNDLMKYALVNDYDKLVEHMKSLKIDDETIEGFKTALIDLRTDKIDKLIEDFKLPKDLRTSPQPIVEITRDTYVGMQSINPALNGFALDEMPAEFFNKMGQVQMRDDTASILKVYDKWLRLWKMNNTAVMPGFHMRNAVSNTFQEYLSAGSTALRPEVQYQAAKLATQRFDFTDINRLINTKKANVKRELVMLKQFGSQLYEPKEFEAMVNQLYDKMHQYDIALSHAKSNQYNEAKNVLASIMDDTEIKQINKILDYADYAHNNYIKTKSGKQISLIEIQKQAEKLGVIDSGLFAKDMATYVENPAESMKQRLLGKKDTTWNPLDIATKENKKEFVGYTLGSKAGNLVENQGRLANFIANVINGYDYYEAAERVQKFMFDYSDLSEFEQKFMKRVIPFYTWMRKNIPLQVEQLLEQPNTYRGVAKAMRNIKSMTPEDERVSKEDMNSFAKEWLQLPIKTKNAQGKEEPVFLNPNLPFADLEKLSLNPIENVQTAMSSMSPFIKLPIEIGMNRNMYFNSPISRGIGDTDDAPGYLQALFGKMDNPKTKQNEALQMSPEIRYILRNIGSLENVSKMIEKSGETVEGQLMSDKALAMLNALGGVKLYSYDVDKYREWALKDRLKQLQDIKRREDKKRVGK